jgi:hypothetical protein
MKIKIIINAVLPLVVSVLLFIVTGIFGISKISETISLVKSAGNDQAALTQKLNLLETLSKSAAIGINSVTSALPSEDSTLTAITQLQVLAVANGVVLSKINSTGVQGDALGLNESTISFDLDGPMPQINSFLAGTQNVAPILVLDSAIIKQKDSAMSAKVTVRSFWSPLPKTIPAVNQPITDLSDADKEVLAKVTNLTQPTFVTAGSVSTGSAQGTNPNPFGQ